MSEEVKQKVKQHGKNTEKICLKKKNMNQYSRRNT